VLPQTSWLNLRGEGKKDAGGNGWNVGGDGKGDREGKGRGSAFIPREVSSSFPAVVAPMSLAVYM